MARPIEATAPPPGRDATRRDGSFTLRVAAEHRYELGVDDLNWASAPWSETILTSDGTEGAEVTLTVSPATPLTARVTRGPAHEPVVGALVEVRPKEGPRSWARADAAGLVRAGVGAGEVRVRLIAPNWDEEQVIQVTAGRPVAVEFHRSWIGERRITGRLLADAAPYEPSPTLVAHAAWPQPYRPAARIDPVVRPDGTFEVVGDGATLTMLVLDPA